MDVVEAYVSRRKTQGQSCRLFGCGRGICVKVEDNSRKSKVMVVGKRDAGVSWKL